MYEISRYSIHHIIILLAKYKSLNYFILKKTVFLESISELIMCPIRLLPSLHLSVKSHSRDLAYDTFLCIE